MDCPGNEDVPDHTPAPRNRPAPPSVGSCAPPSQVHGIGTNHADVPIATRVHKAESNGRKSAAGFIDVSRMSSLLRFGSELNSSLFEAAISTALKYGNVFGGFTPNEKELILSAPRVLGENYDEKVQKLKEIEDEVIQSTVSKSGPDHLIDLQTLQQCVREALAKNQRYSDLQASILQMRVARSQATAIISYTSENQALDAFTNDEAILPNNASTTPKYPYDPSAPNNLYSPNQTQTQNSLPTAPVHSPDSQIELPRTPHFPGHHPQIPSVPSLSPSSSVIDVLIGQWSRGEFYHPASVSLRLDETWDSSSPLANDPIESILNPRSTTGHPESSSIPPLSSPVSVHHSDAVEERVELPSASVEKEFQCESTNPEIRKASHGYSPLPDDSIALTSDLMIKKKKSNKRKLLASDSQADEENPFKHLKVD